MNFLSLILNAVQASLELLLVLLIARSSVRKYAAFYVYVVAAFAADLVDNITYYQLGWKSQIYRQLFWTDHIALNLFLLLVVIAFTYKALGESSLRQKAAKALGAIGVAAVALPFALLPGHHGRSHGHFDSQWFNHTSQILNFGAAIMNLVLWVALLSNRKRDARLLTLSIGVGIVTTSGAIAWGARQFLSEQDRWPVDTLATLAYIASVLIWCWVFRPGQEQRQSKPVPPNAPPDALTTPS